MPRFFILVAAATVAAACAYATPGRAATGAATCDQGAYAYAGIGGREPVRGVSARIAPASAPTVRDGHVDGWVGVGGPGQGPNGTDEWIQIGLTSMASQPKTSIYYEVVRPGHADVTHWLSHSVRLGDRHTFAVREVTGRPNWWRVWLDGSAASAPVFLASSHDQWTAQAIGESWTGETAGACNTYSYAFANVRLQSARSGAWSAFGHVRHFQDRHYQLVRQSSSSFLARSVVVPVVRAVTDRGVPGPDAPIVTDSAP